MHLKDLEAQSPLFLLGTCAPKAIRFSSNCDFFPPLFPLTCTAIWLLENTVRRALMLTIQFYALKFKIYLIKYYCVFFLNSNTCTLFERDILSLIMKLKHKIPPCYISF